MDHISPQQLQKYEAIIDEIDSEHKRYEILKREVERETNKLTAIRIAMEENFAKENVFRVIVKIFSSIFEIYYLYSEEIPKEEFEALGKMSNHKFYLIELYISKLFQQKIVNQRWLINVCVKNTVMQVCKNVAIDSDHIYVIVPFDTSIETATVETTLLMKFDNFSSALKISVIVLDISYHFSSYEKPFFSPLLKIIQNNAQVDKCMLRLPTLEYNFKCNCNTKHFFKSVVQNCYHRLNPETFSAFTKEQSSIITLHFSISNDDNTVIKLDKNENVLSILSDVHNLNLIKKYFIDDIHCQKVVVDKLWLVGLMNMKQYLRGELGQSELTSSNMEIIYEELRKLIFKLVV